MLNIGYLSEKGGVCEEMREDDWCVLSIGGGIERAGFLDAGDGRKDI